MSLDVYLISDTPVEKPCLRTGVFVRRNGKTVELTPEEALIEFPDSEPLTKEQVETNEVYHDNITHNLGEMARKAGFGLYDCLWYPPENAIAKDLIITLSIGLKELLDKPDYYRQFNPANGWGDYEGFVRFVSDYLVACVKYPDATVKLSK